MRILVVEDDPKIAAFIAEGLRREHHRVETAADGETGSHRATTDAQGFDAVVLDLLLPKLDGFGVLANLRCHGLTTPVLMLSALDSVDDRVRGLRAGADDYLIKPFALDELAARLLAIVRRREVAAEPTRLSLADLTLDRLSRRVRRGEAVIELQPKEFALLEYFLRNAGRTLTRRMILEHVWGWTFDPRTNVVDVLVLRLRNKIDREYEPKLIHTVRNLGYAMHVD
jgi:two-component system OmpR family response regulator